MDSRAGARRGIYFLRARNVVECVRMKFRIGNLWAAYCARAYLPALVFLAFLIPVFILSLFRWKWLMLPVNLLSWAISLSIFGILFAGIRNLIRRQWRTGLLNLLTLPLVLVAVAAAGSFLVFYSMFGPSEDGFADQLTIPPDLVVAEPRDAPEARPNPAGDPFQRTLFEALARPGNQDPVITASLPALKHLVQNHPDLLERYLRCSSAWRVFEENGNRFATRRWIVGDARLFTLHGYYTRSSLDMFNRSGLPEFQSRVTLGLSGQPWWRGNADSSRLQAGDTAPLKLSVGNQMPQSHCVIACGAWVAEIFEQSPAGERRLTQAALEQIETEWAPLAAQPAEDTLRASLPPDSLRAGEPAFDLQNSFQPGLYDSFICANPGEPGLLYLKAFEVTRGTPLSAAGLKEDSNEWIGWSDNPAELFFANSTFTIGEGDWGKPYAARFEVWFVPDSGAPERKLMEKTFKIEGWQR